MKRTFAAALCLILALTLCSCTLVTNGTPDPTNVRNAALAQGGEDGDSVPESAGGDTVEKGADGAAEAFLPSAIDVTVNGQPIGTAKLTWGENKVDYEIPLYCFDGQEHEPYSVYHWAGTFTYDEASKTLSMTQSEDPMHFNLCFADGVEFNRSYDSEIFGPLRITKGEDKCALIVGNSGAAYGFVYDRSQQKVILDKPIDDRRAGPDVLTMSEYGDIEHCIHDEGRRSFSYHPSGQVDTVTFQYIDPDRASTPNSITLQYRYSDTKVSAPWQRFVDILLTDMSTYATNGITDDDAILTLPFDAFLRMETLGISFQ